MKNKIIKSIIVLVLAFVVLPMMGQDFLEIHLKNGDFRKFYLKNVTEISISGIDADGILHNDHNYQHLTTINGKYIYSIEDIDSILFTRKDEEIAEKNFAKAMSSIVPTLSTCETIDDVENKINQIKSAEGVENAWSDGHMLYVSIAEGETFSFHFDHEADLNIGYYENAAAKLKAMIPPMKTSVKQNGAKLKAVIINQQHKDESRAYKISNIQDLVKGFYACDIEATYVDEPTIDFFYDNCHNPGTAKHLNIYDYDLILLTTHGGYGDTRYYSPRVGLFVHDDYRWGLRCHQIETSEDIGDPFKSKGEDDEGDDVDFNEKWLDYYKHFKEWRDGTVCGDASDQHINFAFQNELRKGIWYWVAHPVLTEHFFRDIAKGHFNNPKSILFNAACGSLQGDDEYSSSRFANELLKRDLGVYLGYTETNSTGFWAGLNFYYNMLSGKSVEQSRESLISCQKEETEETFKEWKVDKKPYGAKLLILPEDGSVDSHFLFKVSTLESNQEAITKQYNENGYVVVSGSTSFVYVNDLTTLVPTGFQLGNSINNFTEDFPSDDLTPQGNGKYYFSTKLTNLEPGKTYFYRAYTYDGINSNLGEIYSFTTPEASTPYHDLCPDGNHPHMIDLGLPSGTKWSCCNVGASGPTAYGNYYAWGETSTKSTYTKENYKYHHTDSDGKYVYDDATFTMAPTPDQVKELFANCTATETSVDGVAGEKLTSKKNGKKIFLPYGGAKGNSTVGVGEEYQYWTSQLEKSASNSKLLAPRQYSDNETDDLGNPYAFDWYEKDFRYIGKTVRKASK